MRRSIHRLSSVLVAALFAAAAFLPARVRADAPAAGQCMMWKVSSDTATVYLTGSMHVATPEMYPLPKEMEEAFAKSDTLVVEILEDMTDAWIAGDDKAVVAQFEKTSKEHPETAEVTQKIVFDRNGPMAQKVETYLKGNKTIFIVAGVLHMVGDKGIVQLLRNDKFKVEQSPVTRLAPASVVPAAK
jgi:uncharacterized protein YbaP (TraB family)